MSLMRNSPVRRFLKYNIVGALGVGLRFAMVAFLHEVGGLGHLVSAGVAVEANMLHNFTWHMVWTWRERCVGITWRQTLLRLMRFQCTNGAVALCANLIVIQLLVGGLGMHYLPANAFATAVAGIVNFLLANFVVFQTVTPIDQHRRSC